jgi:hypothetical protein
LRNGGNAAQKNETIATKQTFQIQLILWSLALLPKGLHRFSVLPTLSAVLLAEDGGFIDKEC